MHLIAGWVAFLAALTVVTGAAVQAHPPSALAVRRSSDLVKRIDLPDPLGETEWYRFKCKGTSLLYMMHYDHRAAGAALNPPRVTSQSPFGSFPQEFTKWGYFTGIDDKQSLGQYYYGLQDVFRDLGISMNPADWTFWKVTHFNPAAALPMNQQTYVANGYTYRATGAYFVLPINVKSGALIITHQHSARNEAPKRVPPVPHLPELQSTSDIAFGAWSMTPGTSVINHVFTWAIQNQPTLQAIRKALDLLGINLATLHDWPGVEIPVDSDAGKGIIGSPCGAGVAFFLATHKYPLGMRQIKSIRVFEADSLAFMESVWPTIYWEIGPSSPPR